MKYELKILKDYRAPYVNYVSGERITIENKRVAENLVIDGVARFITSYYVKPTEKVMTYWNYFEVMQYIVDKYNIDHHKKFWRWIIDCHNFHNDSFITLTTNLKNFRSENELEDDDVFEDFCDDNEDVVAITKILEEEFGLDEMQFWISW